jgi:ABC-2 type transport system permease protein
LEVVLLLLVYAVVGNAGWSMLAVPALVVLVAAFGFGLGLALAIVNVTFRDVGHLIGVALQLYFYATPIIYPPSFIDSRLQSGTVLHTVLVGNPLAQFVGAFREAMWQLRLPSLATWAGLFAWAVGALLLGWLVFRDRAYRIGEEI